MNGLANFRKREIQNLNFYNYKILDLEQQIEAVNLRLSGVRSCDLSRIPCGGKTDIYYLYEIKEKLQKEYLNYHSRANEINSYLDALKLNEKNMLIDIYYKNETLIDVALSNCMSRETLKRRVKQILET